MSSIRFERLFSMSAFEALRYLRYHHRAHPMLPLVAVADLIKSLDADSTALDFAAAFELANAVPADIQETDAIVFYRACIEHLILRHRPIWVRIMTLGRQKFIQKLSRDEQQCFRGAGLLREPPDMHVIRWLDQITGRIRHDLNTRNLEQGRRAEQLTIQHEIKRLRQLGIALNPRWISIDDNTAGYDVLSYDPGTVEPTARLIEVKSTIVSPLRFTVTRNEWNQALKFGNSYHFHIWHFDVGVERLFEKTVADIKPHIPSDNERGRWRNAEIPL